MLRAERREREGQPMDRPGPDARLESAMNTSGRAAALLVLVVAALTWVGWTAGIERLTRI